MSDCMKNIKGITQIFPELLAMRYFGAFWVCSGMDDNNPTKITWQIFNFKECATICKKLKYSLYIFSRYYCLLKNLAIWLDKSILGLNSRTRALPNMRITQENQQENGPTANDKNFERMRKTPFLDCFALFCPYITN